MQRMKEKPKPEVRRQPIIKHRTEIGKYTVKKVNFINIYINRVKMQKDHIDKDMKLKKKIVIQFIMVYAYYLYYLQYGFVFYQ